MRNYLLLALLIAGNVSGKTIQPFVVYNSYEKPFCITANPLQERIVGGINTTIDKFPYQVSIRVRGTHICGGSIITTKHILTAPRCYDKGTLVTDYAVLAGSTDWRGDTNQQLSAVSRIVRHPDDTWNNLAVVFLAHTFKFNRYVQPIELRNPTLAPRTGDLASATGWGLIYGSDSYPHQLHSVQVPVISMRRCRDLYPESFREGMICAGTTNKGICAGDIGGPLVVNGQLIGVASWTIGCGSWRFPGVFTRVSHYANWLQRTISEV